MVTPVSPKSPMSASTSASSPYSAKAIETPSEHHLSTNISTAAFIMSMPNQISSSNSCERRFPRLPVPHASTLEIQSKSTADTMLGYHKTVDESRNNRLSTRNNISHTDYTSDIFSPKTRDVFSIISPISGRISCNVAEGKTDNPLLEGISRSPLQSSSVTSFPTSIASPRRKRSFEMIHQYSPNFSPDENQRHVEFDQHRPRRQRSDSTSSLSIAQISTSGTTGHRREIAASQPQTSSFDSSKQALHVPILRKPQPRRRPHPLLHSITHLRTQLIPLISVITGLPHPDFPRSLLQYHLLTHAQLDSLARWYHQTTDAGSERNMYPSRIERPWTTRVPCQTGPKPASIDLEAKRRRFGRFIGLRGCDSPTCYAPEDNEEEDLPKSSKTNTETGDDEDDFDPRTPEEDITAKMEREWKAALRQAEYERMMAEKAWRGRF